MTFIDKSGHNESMDQITPEYKEQVQGQILSIMSAALEANTLKTDQTPVIAGFVREKIEAVQTHVQLVEFLAELAQKWPIFASLGNMEMGRAIEAHKGEFTHGVIDKVKSGDIDGALKMAQGLTPHAQ